ncbi:hypothetical protein JOM56_001234 [Amanita muscaria]
MTVTLARPSISQSDLRVRRKPPPILDLSVTERYPPPDPSDPFAPLWVLRSRTSSTQLLQRQSIYNVPTDGRRQSAFSPRYGAVNFSEDDVRCVVSDSEHTLPRQTRRQNRARQRSHSMALLTGGTSLAHEFPSTYSRHEWPSMGLNERSYSTTGFETFDKRARGLHITADTSSAQKKLSQILKPKKLSTLIHSHTPRIHKASISGPVLTSAPPVMNTISLTLQASITDPQSGAIAAPIAHDLVARNFSASQLPGRVASYRPPTSPVETTARKPFSDGPRSPLSSSVSHSAIIRISYPTPSNAYPQNIQDNAFVSPRPAPRPPHEPSSISPTPLKVETKSRKTTRSPGKDKKSKPLPVTPSSVPSEWALPTHEQLTRAASLFVVAESGLRVTFGSLFEKQRTIVIFIRHFWCPLCQDYMSSVRSFVRPNALKSPSALASDGGPPTKLVIVSNGSQAMISKYRQIFRMPFDMYTDPTLAVYTTLGMGRSKPDDDCAMAQPNREPTVADKRKKEKGGHASSYVKHGTVGGIVMVALRALKVGMPVWEKGGDVAQLGGEFVFGPGLTCSYAHRMQSPSGHAPIQDVVKAALEAASKTSAAEKMKKPLPAVVPSDEDLPACPTSAVETIENDVADDSAFSYELVSNETHLEVRETREEQDACIAKEEAKERQQRRKLTDDSAPGPDQDYSDEPSADNASVIVTCSDYASEGSTMQLSPESDSDTLGETDQSDDEIAQAENGMLDMHHAN